MLGRFEPPKPMSTGRFAALLTLIGMLGIIGILATLAGCAKPDPYRTADNPATNSSDRWNVDHVHTPDGRDVLCIIYNSEGISCDWANAEKR